MPFKLSKSQPGQTTKNTGINVGIADIPFARLGSVMADWSEHWFPDAFIFALLATIIVFLGGLAAGSPVTDLVKFFGDGFWSLVPFTMQMVMIIVGGYVVASSPPFYRLIRWLASIPTTPRGAVAFVALV